MASEKEPVKRAVALRYDQDGDDAPRVVATGQGVIAERIVALAEANNVTIERNPDLVDALAQVELGQAIPETLYPVVAEVLVFISRMNREKGKAARNKGIPTTPPGRERERR